MPKSALPPGFIEQAAGTGSDWDNPIQKLWHKAWFAYGPRATEWWAKWREYPVTLLAMFGKGSARFESSDGSRVDGLNTRIIRNFDPSEMKINDPMYLSAIQYWCKWHFAVQWPLQIQAHYYIDPVPQYPEEAGNRRVIYFRIGARRDADKVYWFPSIFIGLQWN